MKLEPTTWVEAHGEPASVLLERIRAERAAAEAAKPKQKRRGRRKKAAVPVEPVQAALPGMDK